MSNCAIFATSWPWPRNCISAAPPSACTSPSQPCPADPRTGGDHRRRTVPPHVAQWLRDGFTADALTALERGTADVGIVRDPQEHDGITLHELVAERLVALVPEDHPAANGSHVAPAVLAASPLILYPRAAGAYAFAVNTRPLRDAGIDVQAAQECSHWQTIIALVAAGLGVTIAPYSVTALLPAGVRRLELDAPKYESRIFLATRCGDDRPLVQALTAASRDGVRHV